jgi:hypothetical protein
MDVEATVQDQIQIMLAVEEMLLIPVFAVVLKQTLLLLVQLVFAIQAIPSSLQLASPPVSKDDFMGQKCVMTRDKEDVSLTVQGPSRTIHVQEDPLLSYYFHSQNSSPFPNDHLKGVELSLNSFQFLRILKLSFLHFNTKLDYIPKLRDFNSLIYVIIWLNLSCSF